MMNRKNTPLTPEAIAADRQSMVELDDRDLKNINGGWGGYYGDFDEDFGGSRRSSFEKTTIIKRRVSRNRYYDYDYDDGWW